MNKILKGGLLGLALGAALVGCGGGGGDNSSAPATDTFALAQAFAALQQTPATINYNVTVSYGSQSCSGTATEVDSAPVASTFEAAPALARTVTLSFSLVACGVSIPPTSAQDYLDPGTYAPVGSVIPDTMYAKVDSPITVPATVKVGDTATIGTATTWSSSAKTVKTGSVSYSYVVNAESASSVVVQLIQRDTPTDGTLGYTDTASYRLTASGTMVKLGDDIVYSNGVHVVTTRT